MSFIRLKMHRFIAHDALTFLGRLTFCKGRMCPGGKGFMPLRSAFYSSRDFRVATLSVIGRNALSFLVASLVVGRSAILCFSSKDSVAPQMKSARRIASTSSSSANIHFVERGHATWQR